MNVFGIIVVFYGKPLKSVHYVRLPYSLRTSYRALVTGDAEPDCFAGKDFLLQASAHHGKDLPWSVIHYVSSGTGTCAGAALNTQPYLFAARYCTDFFQEKIRFINIEYSFHENLLSGIISLSYVPSYLLRIIYR